MVFDKELDENLKVCPSAPSLRHRRARTHPFARGNLHLRGDGRRHDQRGRLGFTGVGVLRRTSSASNWKKTNLKDAVVTGIGMIGDASASLRRDGLQLSSAARWARWSAKNSRASSKPPRKKIAVIIISTSGGARMYEGMFSLMQMAKTCAALAYHAKAKLPYISILTNPTTAGVMASYASVGDLILAEPGHDRLRRTARHQGHDAGRTATRFPDRGIPPRSRPH
jgi:acetyl-CoA carboxylase carboxyl transferase subunit beta